MSTRTPPRALTPWIPPLLVACLIFVLSSFPYTVVPPYRKGGGVWITFRILEYGMHFGQFFLFAVLTYRACISVPLAAWPALGLTFAATLLLSLTNELYQTTIPTRMFSLHDMAMDGLGGSVGLLLTRFGRFRGGAG